MRGWLHAPDSISLAKSSDSNCGGAQKRSGRFGEEIRTPDPPTPIIVAVPTTLPGSTCSILSQLRLVPQPLTLLLSMQPENQMWVMATDRQTQTDRQTDRKIQTERQTDRQTQTDGQTDTDTWPKARVTPCGSRWLHITTKTLRVQILKSDAYRHTENAALLGCGCVGGYLPKYLRSVLPFCSPEPSTKLLSKPQISQTKWLVCKTRLTKHSSCSVSIIV
jgi:hypothetical protein